MLQGVEQSNRNVKHRFQVGWIGSILATTVSDESCANGGFHTNEPDAISPCDEQHNRDATLFPSLPKIMHLA